MKRRNKILAVTVAAFLIMAMIPSFAAANPTPGSVDLVRFRIAGEPDVIPNDDTAATNITVDSFAGDFTHVTASSENAGNPVRHVRNISANAWVPDASVDFNINDGHWINFAFQSPVSINRIEVLERNNNANHEINVLRIEFSDGTEIVDRNFLNSPSQPESQINVYDFAPRTVSWVRIHMVETTPNEVPAGSGAASIPGINNVHIWGIPPAGGGTPPPTTTAPATPAHGDEAPTEPGTEAPGEPDPNGEPEPSGVPEATTALEATTVPDETHTYPEQLSEPNGDDENDAVSGSGTTPSDDDGAGWIIWLIVGIVVIGGGAAAVVVIRKKKE